jgi:hypothetical protein
VLFPWYIKLTYLHLLAKLSLTKAISQVEDSNFLISKVSHAGNDISSDLEMIRSGVILRGESSTVTALRGHVVLKNLLGPQASASCIFMIVLDFPSLPLYAAPHSPSTLSATLEYTFPKSEYSVMPAKR